MGTHSHGTGERSSYTARPSVNQWAMRLSVAPSVTVCVYSCRSTRAQLKVPIVALPGRGATRAITRPVLAPTVGSQVEPVVRTENISCVGKTSMYVFTCGV